MKLQIDYNMEAPKEILSELKTILHSIISAFRNVEELIDSVVEYQMTIQDFLDAVVRVLRETEFRLPGSNEMTTVPEVLEMLTEAIVDMLDKTVLIIVGNIRNLKLNLSDDDEISGEQILDEAEAAFKRIYEVIIDFVENIESLDTILEMIGDTLNVVVEKSQEFVDAALTDINALYEAYSLNIEQLNNAYEYIMDILIYIVDQFNNTVYDVLQQVSEEAQAYVKVSDGRFEIAFPFE